MRFIVMLAIHALAMTVLIGIGVIAVGAAGMAAAGPIVIVAGTGFVLAFPVTWLVMRQELAKTSVRG